MKRATGIIPARFQSSRFPGKPLAQIQGKPMLQWVYEAAKTASLLERIIIATDDERIVKAAQGFGADAVMTSALHASGTERVAEVAGTLESQVIINIQGDEPLLQGQMLDLLVIALEDDVVPMASLMAREKDSHLLSDPNCVKVVVDKDNFALYFSRSPVPWGVVGHFYRHVGIYGFQKDFLLNFARLQPLGLEKAERLEQLRALVYGYKIKMVETQIATLSVDIPEDIIKVTNLLQEEK